MVLVNNALKKTGKQPPPKLKSVECIIFWCFSYIQLCEIDISLSMPFWAKSKSVASDFGFEGIGLLFIARTWRLIVG